MMIRRRALLALGMVSAAILATRAARTNELTSLRRFAFLSLARVAPLTQVNVWSLQRCNMIGVAGGKLT